MTPEHKDLIETLERLMAEEREALRDSVASWKAYDASRRGKEAYRCSVDQDAHSRKQRELIIAVANTLPTLLSLVKQGERDRKALEQLLSLTGATFSDVYRHGDGVRMAGHGFYVHVPDAPELAEYLRERVSETSQEGS